MRILVIALSKQDYIIATQDTTTQNGGGRWMSQDSIEYLDFESINRLNLR